MAEQGPHAAVPLTIVAGATPALREASIQALLAHNRAARVAVLLEGLPSEKTPLEEAAGRRIVRTAPGCLCCVGNLVMRVQLNRLLRDKPECIYIGIASAEHLESLQTLLCTPEYRAVLLCKEPILL